jgi:cell division protein FtsB
MVANFNKKGNSVFFSEQLLFRSVGVIFLVVIVCLIFSDIKIYQKKHQLISQIKSYQKQINDIKKSSQTLKDEIANSNNIDYLEKAAYEQFNEQRAGETVYSFVGSQEKAKTAQAPQSVWDSKTWAGWLSGTWQWLKYKF